MTEDKFRSLALSMPDAEESEHMGHPDFRARGKIFATLRAPSIGYGMVKLTPDQQEMFVKLSPESFQPVRGGWGVKGATNVILAKAKVKITKEAVHAAWLNVTKTR